MNPHGTAWKIRRLASGLVCLLLFASFQLFAAVPKLHNWIHADSTEATHHCSLTLLTEGQVNVTVNEGIVVRLATTTFIAPVQTRGVIFAFDCRDLPSERAPPLG